MKLLINPSGGMSGDIFSAALVSAGADFNLIRSAMLAAAEKLGSAEIQLNQTDDGSAQLAISLDSNRHHLAGKEAKEILTELFERFNIKDRYKELGFKILAVLVDAEQKAHKEFDIVIVGDHDHHHDHNHEDDHGHDHHHDHHHQNDHSHLHFHGDDDAYLHEAQDIVMDIMGAVTGLQALNAGTTAQLTGPVSVGGGHVHCSHGTLAIPAPATTIILREYNINWQKGPIEKELFTPTGAAILAALGTEIYNPRMFDNLANTHSGQARGTKIFDIPPFRLELYS